MSIIVVGLSHRTAPVPVLERAAVPAPEVSSLLQVARGGRHVAEVAVLATCNRLEVYADVDKFHGGVAELGSLLQARTGLPLEQLTPHLYVHYEERAVAHLFGVAAGLDSMVVGEGQILGQVKQALRAAQEAGTIGRVLNELLQDALRAGKRARTETGIDRAGQSVVGVGLAAAEGVLDGLAGRRALVVGAGSLAALAAATLARSDVASVVIANRTPAHAERVAAAVGGRAAGLDALPEELAAADLVVSCTGAVGLVLGADLVASALSRRLREHREAGAYAVIDLALPRDVDPAVGDLPGVHLVDLERIGELVAAQEGGPDVAAARGIVNDEVQAFAAWQAAAAVAPTVVALRARADQVVEAELDRLDGRLPALDDRSRREVAQAVRRVVDKLIHAPTVRAKELAAEPLPVSYAEVLRELFDLGPGPGDGDGGATAESVLPGEGVAQ